MERDAEIERLDSEGIKPSAFVRVTQMNSITEIQYLEHKNASGTASIRKLDKDRYVILSGENAGEICEFNKAENRSQSEQSMRRTFARLRRLINNNFVGGKDELFCTLTYGENMQDHLRLGKDFDRFWKRMRRRFGGAEYIRVSEPQGRGAWHLHVLVKGVGFIENSELAAMWGQGFVKVNSIKGVDNIGAYLTAYLADIPVEDLAKSGVKGTFAIEEKTQKDGTKKKFVKGARLSLYPSGMNYFARSRGIIRPETVEMTYSKAKEKTGSSKPVYAKTTLIKPNDSFTNHMRVEVYNSKRSSK